MRKYKNVNDGNILTEREYNELLLREYTEMYYELGALSMTVEELQEEYSFPAFIDYMYQNDTDRDYEAIEESTLNVEQTIKNLIGMEVTEDFKNDVICAFDTTEEEVIVSEQSGRNEDYQAYENTADAPIICIKIDGNKIIDAWEA